MHLIFDHETKIQNVVRKWNYLLDIISKNIKTIYWIGVYQIVYNGGGIKRLGERAAFVSTDTES